MHRRLRSVWKPWFGTVSWWVRTIEKDLSELREINTEKSSVWCGIRVSAKHSGFSFLSSVAAGVAHTNCGQVRLCTIEQRILTNCLLIRWVCNSSRSSGLTRVPRSAIALARLVERDHRRSASLLLARNQTVEDRELGVNPVGPHADVLIGGSN